MRKNAQFSNTLLSAFGSCMKFKQKDLPSVAAMFELLYRNEIWEISNKDYTISYEQLWGFSVCGYVLPPTCTKRRELISFFHTKTDREVESIEE